MKRSLWLGYSIAPITGPLLYGIAILFFPNVTEKDAFTFEYWFIFVSLCSLLSYVTCFVLGAPLILLLKKYNKLTFIWLSITGASLYSLTIYIILFIIMDPTVTGNINTIILKILLVGFGLGLSVVTVFSYITGITIQPTTRVPHAGHA